MNHRKLQLTFFFTLLIGALVLTSVIFLPYLTVLALAAVLAFVMQTPYKRLTVLFKGRERWAAAATVVVTAVIVLLPVTFIGLRVLSEAKDLYSSIVINQDSFSRRVTEFLADFGQRYLPAMNLDLNDAIRQISAWLLTHLAGLFSQTLQTVLNILLGAIAFYYFLKDGPSFIRSFIVYSPLADQYDKEILHRLGVAVNSVMKGSLFVALVQGVLTGIGLAIFGVPNPTLWGGITAVAALIPGIGTALIIIPSVIFLYVTGHASSAIGLLIWGATAVGLIDNFLGPHLVGRGTRIHPLFVLFSVIGGIGFFGPLGFIFGPVVLSLLLALLDIYDLFVLQRRG